MNGLDPALVPIVAVAMSAVVFAGGLANILQRVERLAAPVDGVEIPKCGAVEPISGWVCTLEPDHARPRHLDEPHGQSFGVAHTTQQGQR